MVAAVLQHLPERQVRVVAMAGHVLGRHAERIEMHLEGALAADEGVTGEPVDLAGRIVRHRIATGRGTGAMHHQIGAIASERLVEGVGEADVEREVVARIRVHLARTDRIETLRRLPVTFLDLGAELSGPLADRIGLEQAVAAVAALFPDLELGCFLEGADVDRRLRIHVELLHLRLDLGGERLHVLGNAGILAGGERQPGGDHQGGLAETRKKHGTRKRGT